MTEEINWEAFSRDAENAARSAGNETDKALANQISSLTRLTDSEINELCPSPADKANLAELIAVVNAAQKDNQKLANLETDITKYSGMIVGLIGKII